MQRSEQLLITQERAIEIATAFVNDPIYEVERVEHKSSEDYFVDIGIQTEGTYLVRFVAPDQKSGKTRILAVIVDDVSGNARHFSPL